MDLYKTAKANQEDLVFEIQLAWGVWSIMGVLPECRGLYNYRNTLPPKSAVDSQ